MYGYRKPSDLPGTIPLFPLSGVLLLPRANLPLNIFEPRYLNMVDDALGGQRAIGMVQPNGARDARGQPALCSIGTLGRITNFAETDDGRYLITLTGLCRFRITQELAATTPYRQAQADYEDFGGDLKPAFGFDMADCERLLPLLQRYAEKRGYKFDVSSMGNADAEALVNASATLIPFDPGAKQTLLEAGTLEERCAALIALLEMGGDSAPKGPLQ
jgi:hypothetical protein